MEAKPTGHDGDFIEDVPLKYQCIICRDVLFEPLQIQKCGHRFCRGCYLEWEQRYSSSITALTCFMHLQVF